MAPGQRRSSLHWESSELWRCRARGDLRGAAGSEEEEDAREEDGEEGKGLYFRLPLNMSLQTKMDNMELRSIDAMAANFHTFILEQVRTLKLCKTGKTNILITWPSPVAPSSLPTSLRLRLADHLQRDHQQPLGSILSPPPSRDWSSVAIGKLRHGDTAQPRAALQRGNWPRRARAA